MEDVSLMKPNLPANQLTSSSDAPAHIAALDLSRCGGWVSQLTLEKTALGVKVSAITLEPSPSRVSALRLSANITTLTALSLETTGMLDSDRISHVVVELVLDLNGPGL